MCGWVGIIMNCNLELVIKYVRILGGSGYAMCVCVGGGENIPGWS